MAKSKAEAIGSSFKHLCREAESMKVYALQNSVEEQKKSAARDRGISSLIRDKKKVRDSLLVTASSFILGGLLIKDKFGAMTAAMSGFDGMVQGLGESKWCVLLGRKILVAPEETIPAQANRIALDSCYRRLEELKKRAVAGEKMGSFDDVMTKLKSKRD